MDGNDEDNLSFHEAHHNNSSPQRLHAGADAVRGHCWRPVCAFSPRTPFRHQGIGVPSDPARARGMYEEACEAGSSAAAYFLGQRLHAGDEELGIEADGARALQLLSRSAEQVRVPTAVLFTWVSCHAGKVWSKLFS